MALYSIIVLMCH